MRIPFVSILAQTIEYFSDLSRHLPFWKENALKVCENEENISGRVVIVTGSNTGIGKQVALQMAKRGAVVIMAVRDLEKGREALAEIKRNLQGTGLRVTIVSTYTTKSVKFVIKNFVHMYCRS